jgi:hypothetical protein
LDFFIGSSFFKWGHIFLLAFLSISLSRTLTHFNSLFKQLSHISILSLDKLTSFNSHFEKYHTFQFSLWTSLTSFNSLFWEISHVSILSFDKSQTFSIWVLDSTQRVFVYKIGLKFVQQRIGFTSAFHNVTCFAQSSKKHKHHKLQWGPIIERSNELC